MAPTRLPSSPLPVLRQTTLMRTYGSKGRVGNRTQSFQIPTLFQDVEDAQTKKALRTTPHPRKSGFEYLENLSPVKFDKHRNEIHEYGECGDQAQGDPQKLGETVVQGIDDQALEGSTLVMDVDGDLDETVTKDNAEAAAASSVMPNSLMELNRTVSVEDGQTADDTIDRRLISVAGRLNDIYDPANSNSVKDALRTACATDETISPASVEPHDAEDWDLSAQAATDTQPDEDDDEDEPIWEVEAIVGYRRKGRGGSVCVKWLGWKETTWEPLKNLRSNSGTDVISMIDNYIRDGR